MSIGQQLRDARISQQISIQEVATAIRLRATLISALEVDDFEICGGEAYGRAHQRMYAKYLGINLVDGSGSTSSNFLTLDEASPKIRIRPIGSGPNWSSILAIATVVVVAMVAVVTIGGNQGVEQVVVTEQLAPTAPPKPTTTSPAAPITASLEVGDVTAQAVDQATIRIEIVESYSWLRVSDSVGATIFQGTLTKGDFKEFIDSDKLSVVIGNSGAASLTINGVEVGVAGSKGQVLRTSIIPGQTTLY